MGKCEGVGARTRARAAGAGGAVTTSPSPSPEKKIKKHVAGTTRWNDRDNRKLRRAVVISDENSAFSSSNSLSETENSSNDSVSPVSCCASINVITLNEMEDLEVKIVQTSSKQSQCRSEERRENKVKDAEMETTLNSDTKSNVQIKIPSESEIEEFFAVAEKDLHKRFTDKYNFDVVNDVPLKGRFEWVQVKP